ncbi:head scaffolding protein [Pseudomonas phage VSW-3]|uniref:Capsid and scaffold protein n=1 Tax=Pseudomonas phage VSW-3 TaxID=1852562 RepID=A0A173GCP4_9CAUD|nr:head scaffolding protein [Pseudomonas phage VSW-3]ANH51096.1 capsid and scaffold protein [Pseudomonas phage VSW-3]
MKRFGIVGMGLVGMSYMVGLLDGDAEAAAPAAAAPAAEAAPAPASVKLNEEAPAAPAPAPKPEAGDADVLDKAGFAPVENDPGLNYAMKFLATNGFDAENPAVAAAFSGDFSLLKAELAAKGIGGWEQALGLAEQSYDRHVKEGEAKATEVGKVVTDVAAAQGVDWEAAVAHVGASATAEERTAINSLLSDPKTAHIAARFITNSFIESGDGEYAPAAAAVKDGAQAHHGTQGGPLSRREYTAEMGKLRESLGDAYMDSPQAQALYRRLKV